MQILHTIVQIGIYVLMAVSVLSAIGAVSLPNIFHAALALIVTLIGTAGIFIALGAEFLAVVQILLYVGAVMTLVIFSIMMTENIGDKSIPQRNSLWPAALAMVLICFFILVKVLFLSHWPQHTTFPAPVTVADLGHSLLTKYAFPFEVISVFLIAALIGAIVIAKKDKS